MATILPGADVSPLPRPIVVMGVERSGTSLVTEMVHRWGAHAGEPHGLYAGDERNPQGFWEYRPLWEFMGDLCKAAGMSWWDAAYSRPMNETSALSGCKDRAAALVRSMERTGRPWVWKYPDLTYFLPFWKQVWGEAVYVVTVRNPHDSALSWQKFVTWNRKTRAVSVVAGDIVRWQLRMLSILEQTAAARTLFISYESLVAAPGEQAARLCAFLDAATGRNEAGNGQVQSMATAVKPEFWRNRAHGDFHEVEQATEAQKALYRFLSARARDEEASWEMEKWTVYPGALDLAKNQELFTEYYNLSEQLLGSYPVQVALAIVKPRGFLTRAEELEKYVEERTRFRRHLQYLAWAILSPALLRCSLQRRYRAAKRRLAAWRSKRRQPASPAASCASGR